MINGILLVLVLFLELCMVYSMDKCIVSPSIVLNASFLLASINLLTNIKSYHVELSIQTVLIIALGILSFRLGTVIAKKVNVRKKVFITFSKKYAYTIEDIVLPFSVLFFITVFNIITTIYVTHKVVMLTRGYGYIGANLGALGRYRELGTVYGSKVYLGLLPTLMTALSEANGYVLGCILANALASNIEEEKKNINIWFFMAFFSSFISTFSQGARGGFFLILSVIVLYLLNLYDSGKLLIRIRSVVKIILLSTCILFLFNYFAILINKNWNVSHYEYLSVYLGNPIINLNSYIAEGMIKSPFIGYYSFRPILANLSGKFGFVLPPFNLGRFRFLNGHNLGNVYTIFAYIIADFGIIGSFIYLGALGIIMQIFNNNLKTNLHRLSVKRIIYAYFIVSLSFSFFSNKVAENLSFYHIYVWIFEFFYIKFLSMICLKYVKIIGQDESKGTMI